MCTKPFSQTKNKGKLFLVAKSSGPLLARMPLKSSMSTLNVSSVSVNASSMADPSHENSDSKVEGGGGGGV